MMGNEKHPPWTGQTEAAEELGGGALASRRDSHTGTKELVSVDKTHTELPPLPLVAASVCREIKICG